MASYPSFGPSYHESFGMGHFRTWCQLEDFAVRIVVGAETKCWVVDSFPATAPTTLGMLDSGAYHNFVCFTVMALSSDSNTN